MEVKIIETCGLFSALLGLSLNKNQSVEHMPNVAEKLATKDGGHNKFLESIVVWLDINAPRYWWSQFDTYRVGITKQSQSTMHTILKRPLNYSDFDGFLPECIITELNDAIRCKNFMLVKRLLPESFLQRRIVCTNYKALRNICHQRINHKLSEWQTFCKTISELHNSHWILPDDCSY